MMIMTIGDHNCDGDNDSDEWKGDDDEDDDCTSV